MKGKLITVAKWVLYPLFYLVCLGLFGYLTFPYDRLRDRLIEEFARAEAKNGAEAKRLEIDDLSGYWFSGVEVEGARLVIPPEEPEPAAPSIPFSTGSSAAPEDKTAAKALTLAIDEAHARVPLWPLLFGEVKINFWVSALGGEIEGTAPVGGESGPLDLTIDGADLGQFAPIAATIGVPLKGVVTAALNLEPTGGKFNKASGTFEMTLAGVSVGDGKAKIMGKLALPEAKVGDLVVSAEAKEGTLKLTKLAASGGDIEIVGEGKITIREPWDDSIADLYVRYKFSDGYRDKNDLTRSLLGAPDSKAPGIMDLDQKVKRAKRPDGFYGWHIIGPLKRLKFEPSTLDGPPNRPGRGKTNEGGGNPGVKSPAKTGTGVTFPLGTSQAKHKEPAEVAAPEPPEVAPAVIAPPIPPGNPMRGTPADERELEAPPPTLETGRPEPNTDDAPPTEETE